MISEIGDKKLSKLKKEEVLTFVTSAFESAVDWDKEWRESSRENYSYYYGDQWTSEEIANLEERAQAVSTYNHIKPAIDSIVGGERKNRPKIMMAGRTPDDHSIAQAKSDMYSYISYNTRSDDELDAVIRDALVTGRGWMHIFPEMLGEEFKDVVHARIDYRDMFVDGLSKRDDLSDARYVHQAIFTDDDIVKSSFPNYKGEAQENIGGFESSSDEELWFENANRKRPRLINTWFRDESGQVYSVVWVKGQILSFDKSPYRYNGFPYVQYTIDRDLDNFPMGKVAGMISAQDEVNKRHSKALHYLNAKQVWAEEGAFVDVADAKKTLAKPDGITLFTDDSLREQRVIAVDNIALANTHIQLMEHAKSEVLALAGINAGYVGQSGNYDSAKKTQMNIAQAQNVLVPMLNKLRIARYQIAYITMQLASDFYTEERLVRILLPNGKYAFMPVNQPQADVNGYISIFNDLSKDDVDIIIEDAPASLNEQEEQLMILLQIQGQTGQPIPPHILLRYTKLRDKEQLSEELQLHNQMEQKLQQAEQMIMQQQEQIKQLGGHIKVQQNNLIQTDAARKVEKEVNKQLKEYGM